MKFLFDEDEFLDPMMGNIIAPSSFDRDEKLSFVYVNSIEDFIKAIDSGKELEDVFFTDNKLYLKMYKKARRLAKKNPAYYFFRVKCFYYGLGVKRNYTAAYALTHKFKDKNNKYYQLYMGRLAEVGHANRKDLKDAFHYYEKATKEGFPIPYIFLSRCYLLGRGVDQNDAMAYKSIYMAASMKNNYAMLIKAKYDLDGFGTHKEQFNSINSINELVNANYLEARYLDCKLTLLGIAREKDLTKPFLSLQEGAKQGSLECKKGLALCYMYGLGTKKNYHKAKKITKGLFNQNYLEALYLYGIMRFNGFGYHKNPKKAYEYFEEANKHGVYQAREIIFSRFYINDKKKMVIKSKEPIAFDVNII